MPGFSTISSEPTPVAEVPEPVTTLQPLEPPSADQLSSQASQLNSLKVALPTTPQQEQQDLNRAAGVAAVTALVAILVETQKPLIASNQDLAMAIVFLMGYAGIIVEDVSGMGIGRDVHWQHQGPTAVLFLINNTRTLDMTSGTDFAASFSCALTVPWVEQGRRCIAHGSCSVEHQSRCIA
jgi:hypothetical protein